MGLRDDFDGLKAAWRRLSPLGKVFFAGTFVVSGLSVGSLADAVFEFKGFLVGAIEFYRSFIGPVFTWLLAWLPWPLHQSQIDVMLFVGFCVACFYRAYFVGQAKDVTLRVKPAVMLIPVVGYAIFCLLVIWSGPRPPAMVLAVGSGVVGGWAMAGYLPDLVAGLRGRAPPRQAWILKSSVTLIVAVIFAVAIIAAISEGLVRPL